MRKKEERNRGKGWRSPPLLSSLSLSLSLFLSACSLYFLSTPTLAPLFLFISLYPMYISFPFSVSFSVCLPAVPFVVPFFVANLYLYLYLLSFRFSVSVFFSVCLPAVLSLPSFFLFLYLFLYLLCIYPSRSLPLSLSPSACLRYPSSSLFFCFFNSFSLSLTFSCRFSPRSLSIISLNFSLFFSVSLCSSCIFLRSVALDACLSSLARLLVSCPARFLFVLQTLVSFIVLLLPSHPHRLCTVSLFPLACLCL